MSALFSLFRRDPHTPLIMGIVNCSPDSLFAGSVDRDLILRRVEEMVLAGVHILDIGGEATNPGIVPLEQSSRQQGLAQCDRVLPIIEAIRSRFDTPLSIDTSEPLVMQEALRLGVDIINDQRSLRLPGAEAVAIKANVPIILMHSYLVDKPTRRHGECMVDRLKREWLTRLSELTQKGLSSENVILDPGFGQGHFGKNLQENNELLCSLPELVALGYPVLVGWSRKSMIGDLCDGCSISERLPGSLAAAVIAAMKGATLLRVHDVSATVQALAVWRAVSSLEVRQPT